MSGLVAALCILAFIAAWFAMIALVVRADARDQAAYERWYDDPARPWNP